MIKIKSDKQNYGINFPSSVDEISAEVLNSITAKVKLPNHYCIVALCFKTRLFDFVLAMNSKKEHSISIVPILAKVKEDDSSVINLNVGDKVIISRSALEMGTHINLPVAISTDNAQRYFAKDVELSKSIINKKHEIYNVPMNDNIIVMEFKIVPISDIKGAINDSLNSDDPFVYYDNYVS